MQQVLDEQSTAPARLAIMVGGHSAQALRRSPGPGKWSVVEIVAHLAEDELSSSWRYRQMLEHPGLDLPGFDQDEWARRGSYAHWDVREALEMFRLLREANVRLLSRLTDEEWNRWGTHAERGRITVADLARHMPKHDARHMAQIERILAVRE